MSETRHHTKFLSWVPWTVAILSFVLTMTAVAVERFMSWSPALLAFSVFCSLDGILVYLVLGGARH